MSELKSFTAGDHVKWSQKITEPTHDYEYIFLGPAGKFTVSTVKTDDCIEVDLPSTQTAAYNAGEYHWFLFSTLSGERYKVADGYISVVYDPTKLVSLDTSSFASRMLISIEKRLEGRILSDHENYSIDGRSLSRIPFEQLNKIRKEYMWIVRKEKVQKGQLKKHRRINHR
jgi:hypothetical protein